MRQTDDVGDEAGDVAVGRVALVGFGLIAVAALSLWWRFGALVFVDAAGAVWSCL